MRPVPFQEFINQGREQESNGDTDREGTEYECQDDGTQSDQPQLLLCLSFGFAISHRCTYLGMCNEKVEASDGECE